MFGYSVRSEVTRKYYERRLRKFFDFMEFEVEVEDAERRYNDFAEKGKSNLNWTTDQIIRFLHFQKERVENKEITAATLKNFIKSLKVFCDSADLVIQWRKITRGLPRGRRIARFRRIVGGVGLGGLDLAVVVALLVVPGGARRRIAVAKQAEDGV